MASAARYASGCAAVIASPPLDADAESPLLQEPEDWGSTSCAREIGQHTLEGTGVPGPALGKSGN